MIRSFPRRRGPRARRKNWMPAFGFRGHERRDVLKLASFTTNGRTSYGAVVGDGIVDLGPRLTYASVLDVLRAGALDEAKKAANAKPDLALKDVTLLRPVVFPEKILCIGVNYGNRHAEDKDGTEHAKYPSFFFRPPGSWGGWGEPLVKPSVTQQFDY